MISLTGEIVPERVSDKDFVRNEIRNTSLDVIKRNGFGLKKCY